MDKVRLGLVGVGGMGAFHLNYMKNELEGAGLTAVCEMNPQRLEQATRGMEVARFTDYAKFLDEAPVDGVLIATPHPFHGEQSRAALGKGKHVMCEKPLDISVKGGRATVEAHRKVPHLKFSLMFQSRTVHLYQKTRELVQSGELGEVTRFTWLITDWFRTCSYYASGGWRATWKGEGGGVLINQCPHNLDMIQWIMGQMPRRITAVAELGKTHPIEVEDEVSAIMEFPNGAVGHFVTSTGEYPGTNRLEIAGDRGKLILENGKLTFHRTVRSVKDVRDNSPEAFAKIETWTIDVPFATGKPEGHKVMTQNWVNAILKNEPLIGPVEDGLKGLEIGNAMLMSGVSRKPVELPMDAEAYDQLLAELHTKYGGKKRIAERQVVSDLGASFAKP